MSDGFFEREVPQILASSDGVPVIPGCHVDRSQFEAGALVNLAKNDLAPGAKPASTFDIG